MQETIITHPDQVTTGWLTEALRRAGVLTSGAVAACEIENGRGNWSTSLRLRLSYTPGAQGECPERLFLKMVDTDTGDGEYFDDSEVRYYLHDYLDVVDAPLLRCYGGAYSLAQRRYHLLLQDVGETHELAEARPYSLEYGLAFADGLSALHARWWGGERLAQAGAPLHSPEFVQRFIEIAKPGLAHLLAHYAGELPAGAPGLLHGFFTGHPARLVQRLGDANGFTLIHGDLGEYNIMRPRHAERPLYFIDRQPFDWSLTTWLGAYDLVYHLVLDWPVEARRAWEPAVLQRYHAGLTHRGRGYPWEQLQDDYRLCLPMMAYVIIEYFRGGDNPGQWQRHLREKLLRVLAACEDWGLCSTT